MEKYRGMGSNELLKMAEEVIAEMRRKAYAEGYEAGIEAVREYDKMFDYMRESDQEARDRIVKQAKRDVERLTDKVTGSEWEDVPVSSEIGNVIPRFVVNAEKRTVVALLEYMYIEGICVDFKGIAKCAPTDCFNSSIGRAIALRRALGLEVPDEYLNAPNPTEARVGDVVKGNMSYGPYTPKNEFRLTSINEDMTFGNVTAYEYEGGGTDWIECSQIGEIIDDSREEDGS